ncbi:MAG: hypothetical protein CMM73_02220 [Rhodospirillaceae bacterium]|nr:hypothetical protein [Rhodospirillaceae bacterium]
MALLMFILIDNYESFIWNLWHFLSDLGADFEKHLHYQHCSRINSANKKGPREGEISCGPLIHCRRNLA